MSNITGGWRYGKIYHCEGDPRESGTNNCGASWYLWSEKDKLPFHIRQELRKLLDAYLRHGYNKEECIHNDG